MRTDAVCEFEEEDAVFDRGSREADCVVELDVVLSDETQRVKAVRSRDECRVESKGVLCALRYRANADRRGLFFEQHHNVSRFFQSVVCITAQKYLPLRRH